MNSSKIIVETCPACGSKDIADYLETSLTTFFFPIPPEIVHQVKKEPLNLGICNNCSHIFQNVIKPGLLDLIYNVFYLHYNLDTSLEFQEVYRARTTEFLRQMLPAKENPRFLDIGCGEGTYFPIFRKLGCECYGIEPSKKGFIAREKNPFAKVSVEPFESELAHFETTFDIILMNWVLEHIPDLEYFFQRLQKYLKIGTRLVIQVPDIAHYMENSLLLFYEHEHINYFSIETLRILLERKGFRVIGEISGDCASILVCGEYTGVNNDEIPIFPLLVERKKKFRQISQDLRTAIRSTFAQYERIILYGLGMLAFWISEFCLDHADYKKIELIDDNAFYQGKTVPSFNKGLKIFPQDFALEETLIFISASPAYHDKIRNRISSRFKGNYQIALIKNGVVSVEGQ